MTLQEQTHFLELFHSGCLAIIRSKNPDYAPDGIPLLDMMAACAEEQVTIPQGLWSMYRKHFSAITKHFFRDQPLSSEPVLSRLQDAANYFGLLAFYDTHKRELHTAWRKYWEKQKCECVYRDVFRTPQTDLCLTCQCIRWLERQAFQLGSDPTSSRSTQKGQG